MKRIGILTYFWGDNPGTFLQAYSMVAAVQKRFPDARVELVDYKHRHDRFHIAKRYIHPAYLLEGYRRDRLYRQVQARYLPRSEASLVTQDYAEAARFLEGLKYDLIVVGSDTILQMPPWASARREPPIYWLPPDLPCRKVACAASANALTYEALDGAMRTRLTESINAFDLVGVRDQVTYELVKALGLRDESRLAMVPDPTFSYDLDYGPMEALLRQAGVDLSGPTVGLAAPEPVGRILADHYRAQGFTVVALGWVRYADWRPWVMSPMAWAGQYKYFTLTITERFHGTVFSLKNLTPVVTLETDAPGQITGGGLSKRFGILRDFDLHETNYVDAKRMGDYREVVRTAETALAHWDRDKVAQRLNQMRTRFDRFLDRMAAVLA